MTHPIRQLYELADKLVERMRTDTESDWPDRLLKRMRRMPLIPEAEIAIPTRLRVQPGDITPAESRVLQAYSRGLKSRTEVADFLGVEPDTVKTQLETARRRLQAKTTTHAVANAIRRGYIP